MSLLTNSELDGWFGGGAWLEAVGQGHAPEVCLTLSFAVYQSGALLPNMLYTVLGFITHGLRSNGSARGHDICKISTLENVTQSKNKSIFKLFQDVSSQQQKENLLEHNELALSLWTIIGLVAS